MKAKVSAAAVTLLAVTTLVGCSDVAPEPQPMETSSAPGQSTDVKPSSSPPSDSDDRGKKPPAPPPLPLAANGDGRSAAKAFVRHWIAVLNYSGRNGQTNELRRLSDEECVQCTAIADLIDQVKANGGSIVGPGWEVRSVRQINVSTSNALRLDATVSVGRQTVKRRRGAKPENFTGGLRHKIFAVTSRPEKTWQISRLDQPE